MSMPSCNLSWLPEDLLIQDVLARLDLPSLRACLLISKHLNHTIRSSALLEYSMKLQSMGMIDNSARSYDEVSINERLERLREQRERWQNFNWRWKISITVPGPPNLRIGYFQFLRGECGVLYIGAHLELHGTELYYTTLPSSEYQIIEWSTFRPKTPNGLIAAYALSIEENDLLACVTYHRPPSTVHPYIIQVHLVQHSTQLPYPGLSSPILEVSRFECQEGDFPIVNLAIREATSPTEFNWTGHLSFWNWTTGEKKGARQDIPDKHMSLVFLRDDVLVHGSSLDLCLDIYHISPSIPMAGDSNIRLIEQLCLPKIKEGFRGDPLSHIDILFGDNATSVTSFTECSNPKVTRMFTTNSLDSIMVIELMIEEWDGEAHYFNFITHYRTLLDRADAAINRYEKGSEEGERVVWEAWGPDATWMFFCNQRYSNSLAASCGTRYFVQSGNEIEVFDFCQVGRTPVDGDRAQEKETGQNEQKPIHLRPCAEQGGDPACRDDCFQDIVRHTKLPFVCETFENEIDGNGWQVMYVDQSRIVGLRAEEIDLIYLG